MRSSLHYGVVPRLARDSVEVPTQAELKRSAKVCEMSLGANILNIMQWNLSPIVLRTPGSRVTFRTESFDSTVFRSG